MNDAAGAAQGVKREVDTVVRNQAEKNLRDLDIARRESSRRSGHGRGWARRKIEALKARIAALEAKLGVHRRAGCRHDEGRMVGPLVAFASYAGLTAYPSIFRTIWRE